MFTFGYYVKIILVAGYKCHKVQRRRRVKGVECRCTQKRRLSDAVLPPKFKMADLKSSMGAVSDKKEGRKSRGNMDIGGLPQEKLVTRGRKDKSLRNI